MIACVVNSQMTVLVVTPNSWTDISSDNPVVSPNSTVNNSGTLYFEVSDDFGDGVEIEYSINNGLYQFIYITGAGYQANQGISVSGGDTIKFRVGKYGASYVTFLLKENTSSGRTIYTGAVEAV